MISSPIATSTSSSPAPARYRAFVMDTPTSETNVIVDLLRVNP